MSENRKPFETFAHYKLGKGLVTLAVSVDEGHAVAGVSYCHPRDGVNKGLGRSIARGRRDTGADFSFKFLRNGSKLNEQIRTEFEQFVKLGGAPPWATHSLSRELRRRNRLMKIINDKPANVEIAAEMEHTHPDTMDCGCL